MDRRTFLALSAATAAAQPAGFAFHEHDGKLDLLDSGKLVWSYCFGPQLPAGVPEDRRRACYFHPLVTPGGVTLTDDFPRDHYHHRGLFWAWPQVVIEGTRRDGWLLRGLSAKHEEWTEKAIEPKVVRIGVVNGWYTSDGKRVLRERVRAWTFAAEGMARAMDLTLTFEAEGAPLSIEGSAERGKSYGGLCIRFAPRTGTKITTSEGVVKDQDLVKHAWAEMEAVFNGKKAALRVDGDARNPGHPSEWCLREYGFIGASYPGHPALTLEPGKPLTLRYRVMLEDRV